MSRFYYVGCSCFSLDSYSKIYADCMLSARNIYFAQLGSSYDPDIDGDIVVRESLDINSDFLVFN